LDTAYSQDAASKRERADWEWIRKEGTAMMVLEPSALPGVSRWTLESPRHRGAILCMAASPDGVRVATGGVDGVVRIWNLNTGMLEKAFAGHTFHLHSMAWSPDGALLATNAWGDAYLRIWEVATGKIKKQFTTRLHLRSLCWSNDSKKLAGGTDGSGRIYVSEDFKEPTILTEMGNYVRTVQWTPDDSRLAVSLVGSALSVLDASKGGIVYSLEQPAEEVTTRVRFSPDGTKFATCCLTSAVVWETESGKELVRVKTPCSDVIWQPDGSKFATLSSAGMQCWNTEDGKLAEKLLITSGQLNWNSETNSILSVTEDKIAVWQPEAKQPKLSIDAGGSHAPIFQAGKPLITGVGTTALSLWDSVTFKRMHKLVGHTKPISAATWSRDGKHFASAAADGTVRLWDIKTGKELHSLLGHKGSIRCLEWSPDGKLLASAGYDNTIRLWTPDGQSKGVLEGHSQAVLCMTWSPNSNQLASGGNDKEMVIWNIDKLTPVKKIPCHTAITAMSWMGLKSGSLLAIGFADAGIRIINPASGEILAQPVQGRVSWYRTSALSWMPTPQPMLLVSRYYLTQLWDIAKEESVQRQMVPGGASSVFPTAGGVLAVARSGDRTTRFWDPAGGSLRGVLLEEGDCIVAISTGGDVKFDAAEKPNLIAILETTQGQKTVSLEELAKKYGWKNNARVMKLPVKN